MSDPCAPWRERLQCDGLVGRSRALADVLAEAAIAAHTDLPVLILGETGTGKNVLARAIHDSGERAGARFVTIANAAPDGLFESQFFGAERGAYTGAVVATQGCVAEARGGTLFVDEIGEIGSQAQAKLLRLVQFGLWAPLGSSREQRADVRIIAATHAEGGLRPDLYHRLAVFPIRMPSLAERVDDVPLLAKALVATYAAERRRPRLALPASTVQLLVGRRWPGNVRELEHVVKRGLERAWFEEASELAPRHVSRALPPPRTHPRVRDQLDAFERWLVDEALDDARGKVTVAARALDVSPSWLYKHLSQRLRRPAA